MSKETKSKKELLVEIEKLNKKMSKLEKSNKNIREKFEHCSSILNDQPQLICRFNPDGILTYVNYAFCEYHNKTEKQLINSIFFKLLPESDTIDMRKHINDFSPYHNTKVYEHSVEITSGVTKWKQCVYTAIFDKMQKLIEIQLVCRDITEHKLTEERLHKRSTQIQAQMDKHRANAYVVNEMFQQEILVHRQLSADLAIRLRYEKGLEQCSRELFEDSEDTLMRAIKHLLIAANANRVYIFENFEDKKDGLCVRQTNEVVSDGVQPEIDNPILQHVSYKDFSIRWKNILSKGNIVNGMVADFPVEEQKYLEPQGILSILIIPIFVDGKWYGFIGFDDTEHVRKWQDEDIRTLRTAAEMIASYIENKRARTALELEHKQLLSIFDGIDEVIYITDPDTYEILYLNAPAIKNWGNSVGKKCYIALQGMQTPCEFCSNEHILGKNFGKVHTWEFQNMLNKRYYRCMDKAILWHNGKYVRFEIAVDITDRKKAEYELKKTEKLYSSSINTITDYIHVVDKDLRFVLINKAFKDINKTLGLETDVIGRKVQEVYPFLGKNIIEQYMRVIRNSETLRTEESNIVAGKKIHTETSKSPIVEDGKITGVLTHMRDITKRKQYEAELQQAKRTLEDKVTERTEELTILNEQLKSLNKTLFEEQKLFTSGNIVIFKWQNTNDLFVDYVSPNVNQVLGYTAYKFQTGKVKYADIIHKDDLKRVLKEMKDAVKIGADSFQHDDYRIVRGNGVIIWVMANISIIRDDNGEVSHFLGYIMDVSEHRKMKKLLSKKQD